MDIRMICMDLDGTALQDDRVSFSPRLQSALTQAHRNGVCIVPVTGRQFGLLPPAVTCHPQWEDLAVLCNGAQVRRLATGEQLFGLDISADALKGLLEIAREFRLPLEFSVDSHLYLTQQSLALQQHDPSLIFHRDVILKRCGVVVESLQSVCNMPVEKVNLLLIPDELRSSVEEALSHVAVSAVWSSRNCMEITHPEAHKGRGLQAVCALRGILPEQTMAIGDSGNDIAMLTAAGLGVAMGNAPEVVKAAADAVTDTNFQDGAAKAIETYVLK